jgi:hypothetical protein
MLLGRLKRTWQVLTGRKRHLGYDFSIEEVERSHVSRLENAISRERNKIRKAQLEKNLERLRELRQTQELRRQEEDIERLEDEIYEDEDEEAPIDVTGNASPDALFSQIVLRVLQAQSGAMHQPMETIPQDVKRNLTDDEIRAMFAEIPAAYRKKAKKMQDEEILQFAKQMKPDIFTEYDDDTLKRALLILKE